MVYVKRYHIVSSPDYIPLHLRLQYKSIIPLLVSQHLADLFPIICTQESHTASNNKEGSQSEIAYSEHVHVKGIGRCTDTPVTF